MKWRLTFALHINLPYVVPCPITWVSPAKDQSAPQSLRNALYLCLHGRSDSSLWTCQVRWRDCVCITLLTRTFGSTSFEVDIRERWTLARERFRERPGVSGPKVNKWVDLSSSYTLFRRLVWETWLMRFNASACCWSGSCSRNLGSLHTSCINIAIG